MTATGSAVVTTADGADLDIDIDADLTGMTDATLDPGLDLEWVAVCVLADLVPERGAAALLRGDQVALFRLLGDQVLAVQNLDPFSGAHVLARGIVGSRGDAPTVASPMYKQIFDLRTGRCLEPIGAEPQHLRVWPVRIEDSMVLVGCATATAAPSPTGVPSTAVEPTP